MRLHCPFELVRGVGGAEKRERAISRASESVSERRPVRERFGPFTQLACKRSHLPPQRQPFASIVQLGKIAQQDQPSFPRRRRCGERTIRRASSVVGNPPELRCSRAS